MMTLKRRAFFGVASLGTVGLAQGSGAIGQYEGFVSRSVPTSLGKGQAASLSIVWTPPENQQQQPLKARLVVFDLDGKPQVEKVVFIEPFSGASIDFEPPASAHRQRLAVFGYVFIEGLTGELAEELGASLEVFDVSSGRTDRAAAPVGLG
jgi:hypothetical protein